MIGISRKVKSYIINGKAKNIMDKAFHGNFRK